VKKNQLMISLLVVLAVGQFGFEWGSAPATKKTTSPAAAPQQPVSQEGNNLPFPQMMGALTQNLTLWPALSQDNKMRAVEAAILIFRERQNSAILRPADFYTVQIDQALHANPALQQTDLLSMLKMMSVMQYDFYNGQDKDVLAKEVLGVAMYESIRAKRPK
jgi:hypothetical protein